MLSLDEILEKLEKSTGYTKQQLYDKILKKQMELSGLVSLEGAAHLVARDLNVNLLKEKKRRLEISNIIDGMKSVDTIGRIFNITKPVEFERKDGSKGKVVNLYVGDKTGFVRVALWDKQVSLIEDGKLNVGDVVEIRNAVAKKTDFGIELRLSSRSSIKPAEEKDLPTADELREKFKIKPGERVLIKNIEEGPAEIKGFIVQIFNTGFLYSLCPKCNTKLTDGGECSKHGKVEPRHLFVINAIVDDGTAYMRIVFFDEIAERVAGIKTEELLNLSPEERYEKICKSLLGKEFIFMGNVKRNEVFDRLEMTAKNVKDVDVLAESKMLLDEIENISSEL
jgi:replication factor A1